MYFHELNILKWSWTQSKTFLQVVIENAYIFYSEPIATFIHEQKSGCHTNKHLIYSPDSRWDMMTWSGREKAAADRT